jgi:hypothetical protein
LSRLIVGWLVVIISSSGCSLFKEKVEVPDIISVGECERGVVTEINLEYVQGVWPMAQQTDVLISGGCYQDHFIKKR